MTDARRIILSSLRLHSLVLCGIHTLKCHFQNDRMSDLPSTKWVVVCFSKYITCTQNRDICYRNTPQSKANLSAGGVWGLLHKIILKTHCLNLKVCLKQISRVLAIEVHNGGMVRGTISVLSGDLTKSHPPEHSAKSVRSWLWYCKGN